jgi:hypothetical protein
MRSKDAMSYTMIQIRRIKEKWFTFVPIASNVEPKDHDLRPHLCWVIANAAPDKTGWSVWKGEYGGDTELTLYHSSHQDRDDYQYVARGLEALGTRICTGSRLQMLKVLVMYARML